MSRDVISAKLDIIFKKIFSQEENEDMLHDFISSLLDIPYNDIQKITVCNPEILPETADGKFSRMDLRLLVDNKVVNVEMQVSSKPDFNDRVLYYWSKIYSGELKSGEDYGELKQTISINIVNFNISNKNDYHSHYMLMEKDTGEIFSDKLSIHFFELKKINKQINKNDRKELWLQLINAESEEELAMLENTNVPVIQKAVMVIHRMSADEKMKEIARMREKALHDEASALKGARAEGRAEGKAERNAEIFSIMKAKGFTDKQINEILKQ